MFILVYIEQKIFEVRAMRFSFKRKPRSHHLVHLIVIAESSKEVEYIERLHKRIKKGLPIGKIEENHVILFCYTHTDKDVLEQDIDVSFTLGKKYDKKTFEPLVKNGGRSEKISSYGKTLFEYGGLKITPYSRFRLMIIHFKKWLRS